VEGEDHHDGIKSYYCVLSKGSHHARNEKEYPEQREVKKLKVCIVGGGGGASNAANVIRSLDKEAEIHVFTDRGEIGNLPCEIPFVLKGDLPTWESSFAFREKFYKERKIEVHLDTEVTEIIPQEKCLVARGQEHHYDKAILDLGAKPVVPSIPGLDGQNEFALSSNLRQARLFEEAIQKHSSGAILGAGQIGMEAAAILKAKGYQKIYLIGRSDRVLRAYLDRDMAEMIEERIRDHGIELIPQAQVLNAGSQAGKKILSLSERDLEVDLVFFALGSWPNTLLAKKAGIKLGEMGAIVVNEYLQTSNPDIYAIGDCMENWEMVTGTKIRYQTATNAARTGRIAGRNLFLDNVIRYQGTVMPFVTEIFGCQVGTVGFTEEYAGKHGFGVTTHVTTTSTRRRMFGGKPIHIKLIADRKTQTLIGAQIIGEELVAGKIDRLAIAIAERVPLQRLALMDTCYSPTTGAGYEAVSMALDQLAEKLISG
jgi:NADPH-dependent 2,4-dienoyl-CoA reductase/sulfur reductase-like enzyme